MAKQRQRRHKRGRHERSARHRTAAERSTLPLPQREGPAERELRRREDSMVPDGGPRAAVPNPAPPTPLVIRAQRWLWLTIVAWAVDALIGWSFSRALVQAHGWDGAGRVIVAAILPVVALIYLAGLGVTGLSRAQSRGQFATASMLKWAAAAQLTLLPGLWHWSGDVDLARNVFFAALAGCFVGCLVQFYLRSFHEAWVLRKGEDASLWQFRAMASGFVLIGGYVGLLLT